MKTLKLLVALLGIVGGGTEALAGTLYVNICGSESLLRETSGLRPPYVPGASAYRDGFQVSAESAILKARLIKTLLQAGDGAISLTHTHPSPDSVNVEFLIESIESWGATWRRLNENCVTLATGGATFDMHIVRMAVDRFNEEAAE